MKRRGAIPALGTLLSTMLGLVAEAGLPLPETAEAGAPQEDMMESAPVEPGVFEGDVRDLPRVVPWQEGDPVREIPRRVFPAPEPIVPEPSPPDPLLRPQMKPQSRDGHPGWPEGLPWKPRDLGGSSSPQAFNPPDLIFAGVGFNGTLPPDPVGDVGFEHYIQMVNSPGGSRVRIFDKLGNRLADFDLASLAPSGFGPCKMGSGDPIVLFDSLANRWLLAEFADPDRGDHLCVYVSRTADPVGGGFFVYDFTVPQFPDYPKYAVWPDAYYVSTNESRPAAYALQRGRMLNGNPAGFQRFTAPRLRGFEFQALTPSDLDGPTPPPPGSPHYFVRHRDDEAHDAGRNDPTRDFLEIWELRIDFSNPAGSSFVLAASVGTAEFDSNLCGLTSFECFPQPGTPTRLDPLREVVMWRSQYRNFGTHEMLLGNFVTDVDGSDHGGIRWYELRKTGGGPWTLFQEGTQAPDAEHRFMGSIAMDRQGDIALGYSVSGTLVFPSIRYTGRLATDPPGTFPQGEVNVATGLASQTLSTRFGDYSAMSVDPGDDCTFWYTNEFIGIDGQWATRIARFAFPACIQNAPPPPPTCRGLPATVIGTEGADVLFGTEGRDVIVGLGGDDRIFGGAGRDTICGGSGNDLIFGEAGRDRLFGEHGRDTLRGGPGRDTLVGGQGRDTLDGGSSRDRCQGGRGRDTVRRCER